MRGQAGLGGHQLAAVGPGHQGQQGGVEQEGKLYKGELGIFCGPLNISECCVLWHKSMNAKVRSVITGIDRSVGKVLLI